MQQFHDTDSSRAFWDAMASSFSKDSTLPDIQHDRTMKLIMENQMIGPDRKILDIGCGTGRHAFALAQEGATVTGIDFSSKMLAAAESKRKGMTDVSFSLLDWSQIDLDHEGWNHCFDLVLANMTPAVSSDETLLKMCQASKNWCLIAKPTRRINSVLDPLLEISETQRDRTALDESFVHMFDLLWASGYCPNITYEKQIWHSCEPIIKAIRMYTDRIASKKELSKDQQDHIVDYLQSIAVNGQVEEETHVTVATLYWQVIDEKGRRL
ncbi:MAG: class I SAM-dependent methyltransferase [Spirochaetia bacterium]|nr:class I SAM-dependent methyltransferase [Spirochaetia bacterium]